MRISLITVAFNSEATIRETVESVRSQKTEGLELEYILIDGGSSDTTVSIAREYNDIFSKVISEKDDGIYHAMNKGISLSSGEIIGFLNSDDCFATDNILVQVVESFKSSPTTNVVYGDINYVDGTGGILRKWRSGPQRSFGSGWHPPHPAFYARKSMFVDHGGFDTRYKIAADFDLMLRFLEVHQATTSYLAEVFVHMKVGGESNRTLKNILGGNREIKASFVKNGVRKQKAYTLRRWVRKFIQRIHM